MNKLGLNQDETSDLTRTINSGLNQNLEKTLKNLKKLLVLTQHLIKDHNQFQSVVGFKQQEQIRSKPRLVSL